jgi:hypothetical protein
MSPTLRIAIVRYKSLGIFAVLFVIYFAIGLHLVNVTSLTSDEPAYIGAAYGYTKGVGLGPEHPLLLKLVNATVLKLLFPDIQVAIPDLKSFDDRGGIRLGAYYVGYDFLMAKPTRFFEIVSVSRLLYLTFNSLLLVWLALYSMALRLVRTSVALVLGVLYVFSPTFYSHVFLVAFDVPVAITALMSTLSLTILVVNARTFSFRQVLLHFLIVTVLFFLALNTKFSNLILMPIFGAACVGTSVYLYRRHSRQSAYTFAALALVSLLIQAVATLGLYRVAFASLPNQSLADVVERYLTGIRLTLETAGGVVEPFMFGRFTSVNCLQYAGRIFWFKENPALFLLVLQIIALAIVGIARLRSRGIGTELRTVTATGRGRLTAVCVALLTLYPVVYALLASRSHFVLGYRYFFPVIIFLYFILSYLIVRVKPVSAVVATLILYAAGGLAGVPQSLSYVNPLWRGEKWLLANDATLNWGQEVQGAVEYLLSHRLLPRQNTNSIAYRTVPVIVRVPDYLTLLNETRNYGLDGASYRATPQFDTRLSDISRMMEHYLVIDSSVMQRLFSEAPHDVTAMRNWTYLQNHAPVYARNDIIFVYRLH